MVLNKQHVLHTGMPDVEGGHGSMLQKGAVCCALNVFWCWTAQRLLGTFPGISGHW